MKRLLESPSGSLVVVALSVVTAVSGLAHRHHAPDLRTDSFAYIWAGGSLADICGDPNSIHDFSETCDACRLVGPALLPGTGVAYGSFLPTTPRWPVLARSASLISSPSDPSRPVRAPPAV